MSEATANIGNRTSNMKMLRAMVGIGVLCALLIVVTYEGTLPRVERLKAAALEQAIFEVLPGTVSTQTYQLIDKDKFSKVDGETSGGSLVYAGYDEEDQLVGVAIEGRGMGYADIISVLYGFDPTEEKIVGIYVLESKETPGLGDKIEKDPGFLENFNALDVSLTEDKSSVKNKIIPVKNGEKQNPWEVDGITGATISSRAIGNILGESTMQWAPIIVKNLETFKKGTDE